MMNARKHKGLGRGLEVLLGADMPERSESEGAAGPERAPAELAVSRLTAGRYQPRTRMDESSLQELAASIRQHGLMQPLVVRPIGAERYEIIAGERRFRAAQMAGLTQVPVIVREVSDENALAMALIENIQRENLNPIEEAQAIARLLAEFAYTHEQAATAIGRSRSATSNLLRLLQLAEPVQTMLLAGDIEMGHARALLPLERAEQILAANRVVEQRLSVRETEKFVTKQLPQGEEGSARRATRPQDPDLLRLAERMAHHLQAPVQLHANARGQGRLVIEFASVEQFEGLRQALGLAGPQLGED